MAKTEQTVKLHDQAMAEKAKRNDLIDEIVTHVEEVKKVLFDDLYDIVIALHNIKRNTNIEKNVDSVKELLTEKEMLSNVLFKYDVHGDDYYNLKIKFNSLFK